MTKFMTLAALAIGFGCTDKDGDSVGESDTDTDADTDSDTDTDNSPDTVEIEWHGSSDVTVTVTGGTGSYDFGITEGGTDAWTAEGCMGDTVAGFGPFCHSIDSGMATVIDCVDKPADVTNNTTLFCGVVIDNGGDGTLTYYVGDPGDAWCWVHGPNESDYSSLGCDSF